MHLFAADFLTFLERTEEKLLSWGFHGVQYDEEEMLRLLNEEAPCGLRDRWRALEGSGVTFADLIRELRRSHLLFRLPEAPSMYRTRMAEGVRLLGTLRQMFTPEEWATGSRLVSDVKIHLRDRLYPKRDISAVSAWDDSLAHLCDGHDEALLRACFDALSQGANGAAYEFSGFQVRAYARVFGEYRSGRRTGTVISAGTGSGKTKAFYVPCFLRLAEEIGTDDSAFTRVIAIYPRNVLLADQLREAVSEAEKLRPVLAARGKRGITFGALLGSTPRENWFAPSTPGKRRPRWQWEERGGGHVIPYLTSPSDGKSDLIWRSVDRESGSTALHRLGEPSPDIRDGLLKITRESIAEHPPDILFLSLEMLNREMGNPQWRRALGVRQGNRAPRLVLLDEAHTYEGISGAQAAWVLRRWKYWAWGAEAKPPHFVGLSATLKEAPEHLARLCGLFPEHVVECKPRPGTGSAGEMEAEGQEYNIALKGDPASGSSLLSTTIQTGMLLSRLLTPRDHLPVNTAPIREEVLFLKKLFGFTDNLDSLNRWLANTLDAESVNRRWGPAGPLARFRSVPVPPPDPATLQRMRDEGQVWDLPSQIGHVLDHGLFVSRCSSQDPGADTASDVILATSSLEVGFDDPEVGAILHHKAPTSMASFVQRKGRAGRARGSRPWTVVVLSDYGRDRWTFQAIERLFDPEIDSIHLPVLNPYVVRVQLALFLVDWLGQEAGTQAGPFAYLSRPARSTAERTGQRTSQDYLDEFVKLGAQWERFYKSAYAFYFYARGGLSKGQEQDEEKARHELNEVLWEEPRGLLTEAIPRLRRQLQVEWKYADPHAQGREDAHAGRPMPLAIPKATFEALDLNEARIELEPFRGREKDHEWLALPQFLREACPGRVSKRYSTARHGAQSEPGYWHGFSAQLNGGQNDVNIDDLFPGSLAIGTVTGVQIFQPRSVSLDHIPPNVGESSSGDWGWQVAITPQNVDAREVLPLAGCQPWCSVFSRADAFINSNGCWVEVLRYASECEFETRISGGDGVRGTVALRDQTGHCPVAVGFILKADGVIFNVAETHLNTGPSELTPQMTAVLRREYFLHQLMQSPILKARMNSFQTAWMAHIAESMLCATALRRRLSLVDAQAAMSGVRKESATKVLDSVFQMRGVDADGHQEEGRLKEALLELWDCDAVIDEIQTAEPVLWGVYSAAEFDQWLEQRHVGGIAHAIRVAAVTVADHVSEDDLLVDVIRTDEDYSIALTEKCSGGMGQVEAVVTAIQENPRLFCDALEHALITCPRATWAEDLNATVTMAHAEQTGGGGDLASAFQTVRDSATLTESRSARRGLIGALQERGLKAARESVAAVCMRLLRPGSSARTDTLTYALNRAWHDHSRKLGLMIPLRTFAYVVTSYAPARRRLERLFQHDYGSVPSRPQLYAILQQMLLEGCEDSCPDCLDHPNRYTPFGKPDRNLSAAWLSLVCASVEITGNQDAWVATACEALRQEGRVAVVSNDANGSNVIEGVRELIVNELDTEVYRDAVHVSGVSRTGGKLSISLQIRNFCHAE